MVAAAGQFSVRLGAERTMTEDRAWLAEGGAAVGVGIERVLVV